MLLFCLNLYLIMRRKLIILTFTFLPILILNAQQKIEPTWESIQDRGSVNVGTRKKFTLEVRKWSDDN